MENILSACFDASTVATRNIASYSHVIPIVLSLILGIFVLLKAKLNFFSKLFFAFIIVFSLWLLGDFIIWTSEKYNLIYALWAPLDYIEIVFYILGFYFATVFVRKSDISLFYKVILFCLTVPAFLLTISKQSVTGFNSYWCEASNNEFLGIYKLIIESIILLVLLGHMVIPFIKKQSWKIKKANLVVLGSMFLFLSVFGVTEYLASVTGNYELNLYSLFLLPLFLVAIIYSVFELDIFNFQILGTHYLVVGLMVLIGGQLFFINSASDRLLTIITLFVTFSLSIILFRNLKRESDQRTKIEKLNTELKELIQQRESLVHLITHKVKGSFTRTKYVFAEMLNDSFGPLTPEMRKMATTGLESDDNGIKTIDMVLNASNLQNGAVKYDMKKIDLKDIVLKVISEKGAALESKGLKLEKEVNGDTYNILGDAFWLKEVINNFIDNSVKYTKTGSVNIGLKKENNKIIFYVKDTGVGITPEDMKNLFTEGGRGKDSVKVNVDSTGYGLFSVKLIMDAHGGQVSAESEGKDKGSTFFAEFSAI